MKDDKEREVIEKYLEVVGNYKRQTLDLIAHTFMLVTYITVSFYMVFFSGHSMELSQILMLSISSLILIHTWPKELGRIYSNSWKKKMRKIIYEGMKEGE